MEENERVDEMVKAASENPDTIMCKERFTSLVHFNHIFTERKWKETKYWLKTKHQIGPQTQWAWYESCLDTQRLDREALKETISIP